MKLLFATTNKGKITLMKRRTDNLGIELISLNDISVPQLNIEENGNSPLENAKIKALAYYDALKVPLFSCDSGLYIDGLDESRQPAHNVRGKGSGANGEKTDDETIDHYITLANEMGGEMTARYKNAICLILDDGKIYEHIGDDISSRPFIISSKPHNMRIDGFPLDSLSIHIESGKYYFDLEQSDKYWDWGTDDGYTNFFRKALNL